MNEKEVNAKINKYSNHNNEDDFTPFNSYKRKNTAIDYLEDEKHMIDMIKYLQDINRLLAESADINKENKAVYSKLNEAYVRSDYILKQVDTSLHDASKNASQITEVLKIYEKVMPNMSNKTREAMVVMSKNMGEMIDYAKEFGDIMGETSKSFSENLKDNLVKAKDEIRSIINAWNLDKLVTGGLSVEDLRKMQGGVKINLNIDDAGFKKFQGDLINQNRELLFQTGEAYLSFTDAVSYMSSIQDYSVKNYNQATAMYKQITLGTKYLAISNQSLSSIVKSQNAIADETITSRQLAMMAALGTDNNLAENINSVSDFLGTNLESVYARYNNAGDVLGQSVAFKTTADALLGNNANLISGLMSEIMSKSDFSQLSEGTKTLLNYAGSSNNIQAMMRSGNLDMNSAMTQTLTGLSGLSHNQKIVLENLGLGDYVNIGSAYTNNYTEFQQTLDRQYDAISSIDYSSAKSVEEIEELLASQNDNKTWFEKIGDSITSSLGLQNVNWRNGLGALQGISSIVSAMQGIISGVQLAALFGIKKDTMAIAGSQGSSLLSKFGNMFSGTKIGTFLGTTNAGFNLLGSAGGEATALTGAQALGIAGVGLSLGVGLGLNDAAKMSEGEGLDIGDARGFFLGTGSSNKSTGENVMSVLGNTLKGAAVGAAIGSIIPGLGTVAGGLIGGAIGAFAGVLGTTLDENTEALEDNTASLKSNDSIATNSALATLKNQQDLLREANNNLYPTGAGYGKGKGGMGGADYPWSMTSDYGPRDPVYNDAGQVISSGFHHGIDLAAAGGTPIGAAVGGRVVAAGWNGTAGIQTVILGDNGKYYRYFHQSQLPPVQVGDVVKAGDVIGYVGTTGASSGNHLHFQVDGGSNASSVDPKPYVTSSLFSASGAAWIDSNADLSSSSVQSEISGLPATIGDANSKALVSKDSVFKFPTGGASSSDVNSTGFTKGTNYATSEDINRLITVIQNLNDAQQEQRQFMQALSGKNTFIYGR